MQIPIFVNCKNTSTTAESEGIVICGDSSEKRFEYFCELSTYGAIFRMMTALDIILTEIKTLESLQVHSSFNASKDSEQQKSEFVIWV